MYCTAQSGDSMSESHYRHTIEFCNTWYGILCYESIFIVAPYGRVSNALPISYTTCKYLHNHFSSFVGQTYAIRLAVMNYTL